MKLERDAINILKNYEKEFGAKLTYNTYLEGFQLSDLRCEIRDGRFLTCPSFMNENPNEVIYEAFKFIEKARTQNILIFWRN